MAKTDTTSNDSGFAFKLLVRLSGLGAIGALFLPFFREGEEAPTAIAFFQGLFAQFQAGGLDAVTSILNLTPNGGAETLGLALGAFLLLAVPVVFVLVGLYMFLTAKYSGGPVTLVILILLGGWLGFMFGGPQISLEVGFFSLLSYGFWVGIGAFALPFLGMFFLDKSI